MYRFGVLRRGYETLQLRWQPRTESPTSDTIRAFERLEGLLSREYRGRNEGETARSYLVAAETSGIDARVHRVGEIYEKARYSSSVSRSEADTAIELVDALVKEKRTLPY